jgi:hypothetical protein
MLTDRHNIIEQRQEGSPLLLPEVLAAVCERTKIAPRRRRRFAWVFSGLAAIIAALYLAGSETDFTLSFKFEWSIKRKIEHHVPTKSTRRSEKD